MDETIVENADLRSKFQNLERAMRSINLSEQKKTETMGFLAESFKVDDCFNSVNIDTSKSAINASLLSDIEIYDGKQPSKLGEWFADIELAASQLGKNEIEVAWVKSRGLIRNAIMNAITKDKEAKWKDIKDEIEKNIHTRTS